MAESNEPHDVSETTLVSNKVDLIEDMLSTMVDAFSANSVPFTQSEEESLAKVRTQLEKLSRHKSGRNSAITESDSFSDSFLETFTTCAFPSELDALRTSEEITTDDLATLAATIRSFADDMSADDRVLYTSSLS